MQVEAVVLEQVNRDTLTWMGATELDAATCNLFQNAEDVDEDTVIGDLTVADYTGNGAEELTWHDVSRSDEGVLELVSDPVVFRPTGTTITNQIYGAFIKSSAGGTPLLIAARLSDDGMPMASADDEIMLVVRVRGDKVLIELIS